MRHLKNCLNNEQGVSLIPVMIILFIGTLIGIAASTTSRFEVKIAVNDRNYKQNFYRADGTNQQGSQLIENTSNDDLKSRAPTWLTSYDETIDYLDLANYVVDGDITNTKLMAVDHGAAPGAEISTGSPFMHALGVYGRYDHATRGRVIIETEYRKKY